MAGKAQPPNNAFVLRRPPSYGRVVEKPHDAKGTLLRLLRYFLRSRKQLVLLLLSVFALTLCSLATPALQGHAIDSVAAREWPILTQLLWALVLVYALQAFFSLSRRLLSSSFSQRIVRQVREDLFARIVRLPLSYLDRHPTGDVMSRMINDVENLSSTLSTSLGALLSSVLTLIGTVVLMFIYCWQLTLITMSTVFLTVFVTKRLSGRMRVLFKSRSQALGTLNAQVEEIITGYRSVAAFNRQESESRRFEEASDRLARAGARAEILASSMGPVMNSISNLSFVIVAVFGGYFAYSGLITIGVISAFVLYAKQFSRPINEIAQLYGSLQTAIAGAERVFSLMDVEPEEGSEEAARGDIIEDLRGHISFRHVHFSYEPGVEVLNDFHLEVRSGQKIALVGETGSGKTTVVNLLMRFYPLDSGEILLDGRNIQELDRDWLRRNTAIVLQDTVLFSDSVENNIRYAKPTASEEEVLEAAKLSNAAPFIEKLPGGYKSYLKQAGTGLSQGQRQLLNIARAILADPKILILDEATSSVDTRTEKHIQDALLELMRNRTSLIIAHRLSTIRDADCIVVLAEGRVVETGTHEELLLRGGAYAALYRSQFGVSGDGDFSF